LNFSDISNAVCFMAATPLSEADWEVIRYLRIA